MPAADHVPVEHEQTEASLSLWTDTKTRGKILDFVTQVINPQSAEFIDEAQRIAVFDNDGTLWSEQPMYAQLAFLLDRVKALAPEHPEWKTKPPFKAALEGDMKGIAATGTKGLIEMMGATHGGMTSDAFEAVVQEWLKTAKHPKYNRLYTELTYAPMVQLLGYLRAHAFKTFIVSGGGTGFMRPFTAVAYGIPPEQVVGSRVGSEYDNGDQGPVIMRSAKLGFVDDGAGKPVGIYEAIGQRPVFAAGNSDGDLEMLKWTKAGAGPRLALLIHHTDELREVAYDRDSAMGRLDVALDAAKSDGWVVVDMKTDWETIFSFQK